MTRGAGGRSPANIMCHLRYVDFPVSRDELVALARESGAEDEVLRVLGRVPDEPYEDMADIVAALGEDGGEAREDEDEPDAA